MPRTTLDDVMDFHTAYGVTIKHSPDVSDQPVNALRIDLLQEELDELKTALASADPVATLDALADLQYVLDGTFISLGFASLKSAAMAEVHRSNMSKLGADGKPVVRVDGKILKGPNYFPPDLKTLIKTAI